MTGKRQCLWAFLGRERIMHRLAALVLIALFALPAVAYPEFPGKGSKADWDKAVEHFRSARASMAMMYRDAAIREYRRAIAVYPYDLQFYFDLGYALDANGETKAAEDAYARGIMLNTADWRAFAEMADFLEKHKRNEEALRAMEKAVKRTIYPSDRRRLEKRAMELEWKISKEESLKNLSGTGKK